MTVPNPLNEAETETIRLWPDHCIQDSPGAQFTAEFDTSQVDRVVQKGQDHRVEMFSAFKDTYTQPCVHESALSSVLKDAAISHVYVVGLAEDFCVRFTALHAASEGYTTCILEEGTRAVDQSEAGLSKTRAEFKANGVEFVSVGGAELQRVRDLG